MELMTPEQVSEFLKVTPRAVYEMTRTRSQVRSRRPLPCIRLHKKCLRFDKEAVERWVAGPESLRRLQRRPAGVLETRGGGDVSGGWD